MAKATFAMGCFWKPEMIFREIAGVTDTEVGFAGGHVDNPGYRQVCQGDTGHAEVVQVTYEPATIGYEALLDIFWANHDATTRNRQGMDTGRQYRSAIFAHDDTQLAIARQSLEDRQSQLTIPIVTEVDRLSRYSPAEEYHQRYLEKAGAVC